MKSFATTSLCTLCLMLVFSSPAVSQCSDLLRLECPFGLQGETICIEVRITNCAGTIDALGFEIIHQPEHLLFTGADRTGTLSENWMAFDATPVGGMPERIRVGGFDPNGFEVVTDEVLVKLCFEILTPNVLSTPILIDPNSLVDGVQGFGILDCGVPLPTAPLTWGAIKAIYETW